MQSKREILQKALENINHPLSEITRRTTYRGHSPGVKPMTGIKLNLPKTSTMAAKMERVLADKSPEGKKRMKQMNNLVIGREEDGDKISLEFKTASSRERFRKMMNELSENVHLDEATQHIVNVNVSRTGFRKLEAMIASLNGYRESDYSDGKARFYFDAKKHDSAERKKVAEFINKTRGAEFSHAMKEDVQLDEGTMNFLFDSPLKAGAFAQRIMRDKLASEVDRYVDHGKRKEVVELITHPNNYEKNDILKLAKQYKGTVHSVEEDVQLSEETEIVNFNFDNRSDAIAFGHQAKKQGLALRAKEFESQGNQTSHLAVDTSKLKTIGPKLKKLAKKYMGKYSTTGGDKNIDKMMREDVQLDETMTARDLESMIKGLKKGAKQEIADVLNDMNLGGYGDYEARVDNVHKFKTKDLFNAMKKVMRLESLKMSLDEKQKMTYVIDRKTKKIVLGPTGVADAKRYLEKQIQPRKFMIRDIRGAAKKVGDTV